MDGIEATVKDLKGTLDKLNSDVFGSVDLTDINSSLADIPKSLSAVNFAGTESFNNDDFKKLMGIFVKNETEGERGTKPVTVGTFFGGIRDIVKNMTNTDRLNAKYSDIIDYLIPYEKNGSDCAACQALKFDKVLETMDVDINGEDDPKKMVTDALKDNVDKILTDELFEDHIEDIRKYI